MNYYVDTSVVIRTMLNQEGAIRDWSKVKSAATSDLLFVEFHRTIDRLRLSRELTDADIALVLKKFYYFMESFTIFAVTSDIIQRASQPFATVVHTLDALHLATALLWKKSSKKEVVLLTHDRQLGTAAMASNLEVIGI